MSTQNVNVARFARNVEWDFFCDFQTPWGHATVFGNYDENAWFFSLLTCDWKLLLLHQWRQIKKLLPAWSKVRLNKVFISPLFFYQGHKNIIFYGNYQKKITILATLVYNFKFINVEKNDIWPPKNLSEKSKKNLELVLLLWQFYCHYFMAGP